MYANEQKAAPCWIAQFSFIASLDTAENEREVGGRNVVEISMIFETHSRMVYAYDMCMCVGNGREV
jgi:hypothetical protein